MPIKPMDMLATYANERRKNRTEIKQLPKILHRNKDTSRFKSINSVLDVKPPKISKF
jgi:hypothetical protein